MIQCEKGDSKLQRTYDRAATIDPISDSDPQSKDAFLSKQEHDWFNSNNPLFSFALQKKYSVKQLFNYHENTTGKTYNSLKSWILDVKTVAGNTQGNT